MKKIIAIIVGIGLALWVGQGLMVAPNDPQYPLQTGLVAIKAEGAWQFETGGPTKTAIIGSGLGFTSTVIADIPATVIVTSDAPDPYDDYLGSLGASTSTASIAFALTNNSTEIAGIDSGATLRVYKANRENHDSDLFPDLAIATAINDAVTWGAQVIQIDPTVVGSYPLTLLAVNNALFYDRIVVIGVASYGSGLGYLPVNAGPELIVVSSTDEYGNPYGFDGEGAQLDLSAPGVHIWSRANASCCAYFTQGGTSAAFVTGVAGLLRDRLVGEYNTRRALLDSATDLGSPGRDDSTGWGLLNAKCAMAIAGDMNNNRNVDNTDALAIIGLFGTAAGDSKFNVNGDSAIDLIDALVDLALFGANCT